MIKSPLSEKLKPYRIILASASPRRQQFLEDLGLDFEIRGKRVREEYPPHLKGAEIPEFLAVLKAAHFRQDLHPDELLVTADTVVWHNNTCLGKPGNAGEACLMLERLSGGSHQVITAACFTTTAMQRTIHCTTQVKFRALTREEIHYYVDHYQPYDKAGGYGIQEWIGLIGIEEVRGSYFNVMGLPTHLVYKTLAAMVG